MQHRSQMAPAIPKHAYFNVQLYNDKFCEFACHFENCLFQLRVRKDTQMEIINILITELSKNCSKVFKPFRWILFGKKIGTK